MDLELNGRTYVIGGGTDGLGLALAQRLMGEGANVAVCGRDEERLARTQELLGPTAVCYQADVTVASQIEGFIDTAVKNFGRIDGLVNNAGRVSSFKLEDASDQDWAEDFELKVMAAVRASRYATKELEKVGGSIINVLAISARTPSAGSTPTAATRAAGLALTKALSNELGPRGIRVNALLIGLIESGQWAHRASAAGISEKDFYARAAQGVPIPLGRYGKSEEFADVATFLLSPRASYITGVGLSVDGGLSPTI